MNGFLHKNHRSNSDIAGCAGCAYGAKGTSLGYWAFFWSVMILADFLRLERVTDKFFSGLCVGVMDVAIHAAICKWVYPFDPDQ